MKFVYEIEVVGRSKKIIVGHLDAKSSKQLSDWLEQNGFYVQSIKLDPIKTLGLFLGKEGFSDSELENFCANLSELLATGISYQEVLKELQRGSKSAVVRTRTVLATHFVVFDGLPLAQALEKAGFPEQLVQTIDVGIKSSNLEQLLEEYIEFLKWRAEAKRKLRGAAAYPLFIFLIVYAFIIGQAFFVFPKISSIFEGATDLPIFTKIILWMSQYAAHGAIGAVLTFFIITSVFFSFLGLAIFLVRTLIIQASPDSFLGKSSPAQLIRMASAVFFLSALRFAIRSGLPYQKALELAADSVLFKNTPFSRRIYETIEEAKRGKPFEAVMKEIFRSEPYALSFLVGLSKKDVTQALDRAVEILKKKVERQIEPVAAVLRYASLFLVGFVVALVLFSTYFPIYNQLMKIY